MIRFDVGEVDKRVLQNFDHDAVYNYVKCDKYKIHYDVDGYKKRNSEIV